MDQLGSSSKEQILDGKISEALSKDSLLQIKGSRNQLNQPPGISEEELKIRGEIEKEVERGMEEEIKEGLCHLALRLQRLYKSQNRPQNQGPELLEVNISIKIEGGTRIEIMQTMKGAPSKSGRPRTSSRSEGNRILKREDLGSLGDYDKQSWRSANRIPRTQKKFDWVRSLRSADYGNKKDASSYQRRLIINGRGRCPKVLEL